MLIAERLVNLRKSKGFTQKEISFELGLERTTYVKYETGGIQPPNDMIIKLAELFGVTTDYLLGVTENPVPEPKIPNGLKEIVEAFNRKEFEGLTDDEINALAIVAKTLKGQRRK